MSLSQKYRGQIYNCLTDNYVQLIKFNVENLHVLHACVATNRLLNMYELSC